MHDLIPLDAKVDSYCRIVRLRNQPNSDFRVVGDPH